jgi:Raf kinase inhibitor-like YbhB/YbcL family protein
VRRLALLVVPIVVLAACAHDGRTLRTPGPDQTQSLVTAPTTDAVDESPASTEALNDGGSTDDQSTVATTPAGQQPSTTSAPTTTLPPTTALATLAVSLPWANGARMPDKYTCNGRNVAPAMSWTGVPAGTKELAIIVSDDDSDPPASTHWVVAGLPATLIGLAEGPLPAGAVQAQNDAGFQGWGGACPYTGLHHYSFSVYALGAPSGVTANEPSPAAVAAIQGAVIGRGTAVGTYGKA